MNSRPIPIIPGFLNHPTLSQYATGLRCCWDMECQGGKIRDVVAWLREHRPHFSTRVTAIVRTHHSTWVVDVCEENVRITHFQHYDTWMSERMKLWWRERKNRLAEVTT